MVIVSVSSLDTDMVEVGDIIRFRYENRNRLAIVVETPILPDGKYVSPKSRKVFVQTFLLENVKQSDLDKIISGLSEMRLTPTFDLFWSLLKMLVGEKDHQFRRFEVRRMRNLRRVEGSRTP